MSASPASKAAGRPAAGSSRDSSGDRAELAELAELRAQLREAQETIEAIRDGSVDSLVIGPPGQEQVYSVASADRTYRLLVEAMSEGAATVSPLGVILDANPRLGAMTGRSGTDLTGTAVLDLAAAARRAKFTRLLDVGAGDSAHGEVELTRPDGRTVPVLLAVSGFDLDGMLLRCLVLTDLTEQRAAEVQAAAAHEALRVSEARLRALFENAPVGIAEVSLSGELLRTSSRFREFVGYTAEELRTIGLENLTHPGDREADTVQKRRLLAGETDTYSSERRYLRKDGDVVLAEMASTLVRDSDGQPLLYVGTARDVTAQRHAEAQVRMLNTELEARVEARTADLAQANKNLETFSYSVSHDLRAPLRALSGYSEALLEEYSGQLGETGRGYAVRIQAASARMATLIDDLLQLARVSRSQMDLQLVDLSAEVAAVAGELQSVEPGRKVRISIQDGVQVTADLSLIRTVVQNLVGNAWKFTARREDAAIEFGTVPAEDAGICCFLRDNGAGFDPAHAAMLFEPFQRLHAERDFAGTGIGLASVRRIIERHGGRIWAHGEVGAGATFYFTLHAADAS